MFSLLLLLLFDPAPVSLPGLLPLPVLLSGRFSVTVSPAFPEELFPLLDPLPEPGFDGPGWMYPDLES
ncbi:hypothetical protein Q0F98_36925 [Paenibacillus amylolyticus]|nr:hypothetical protein Q0F98_36925 [Paenibacillus amylolyticus]